MADAPKVPAQVRRLAAQMADPNPMRRGSLSQRYVKCSKPGCACLTRPEARHGPYYSLTRAVRGQTRSRFLTADQAPLARQQIETGQQFRRQVDAYWEACESWADAQLAAPEAVGPEAAKKGASRRPSTRTSSRRSKPS